MKTFKTITALSIVAAAAITGCTKNETVAIKQPEVKSVIITSAGDSATVVQKINLFRLLAGDPLNTAPGATAGRREVNWDAVPAALTNTNTFPSDFFNTADPALPNGRKRGMLLGAAGTNFRVDSTGFTSIDAPYATQFKVFSKKKLFAAVNSTVTEVTFKVPGTNTDAFVKGFGVIFTDVDDANSSTVEYYNGSKSLGVFKAPAANANFSFVGVGFPDEKVTRVKITSGNGVLATGIKDISNGGTKDLVVMDDFIYNEPVAQ